MYGDNNAHWSLDRFKVLSFRKLDVHTSNEPKSLRPMRLAHLFSDLPFSKSRNPKPHVLKALSLVDKACTKERAIHHFHTLFLRLHARTIGTSAQTLRELRVPEGFWPLGKSP